MEIKPGVSLATVSAVLHTKDNKHILQVLSGRARALRYSGPAGRTLCRWGPSPQRLVPHFMARVRLGGSSLGPCLHPRPEKNPLQGWAVSLLFLCITCP